VGLDIFFMGILGLIFGSFLNMLIYRLPLDISLISPKRSICPRCDYKIKWYENIPLISYVLLNAKCSNCKEKISILYPIVELLSGFFTVLIFIKFGFGYEFLFVILLVYLLLVLSFIDLKFKAVPDYLLILSTLITLIYIISFKVENIKYFFMFAGAIVLLEMFVTFYIQNIKARLLDDKDLKDQKSLGEGDIPIVAIIGGILGLKLGLIAIFLSAFLAIIPALINLIIKKDIETPFIPFLTLGFMIVFLYDNIFLSFFDKVYG